MLLQNGIMRLDSAAGVILFGALFFGFPGTLLVYGLLDRPSLTILDKAVLSCVAGMQLVTLIATPFLVLGLTLGTLHYATMVVNSTLFIVALYSLIRRYRKEKEHGRGGAGSHLPTENSLDNPGRNHRFLLGAAFTFSLGVLIYTLVANATPFIVQGDTWTYQAYIRHYADWPSLDPTGAYEPIQDEGRMGLIGWPVVLALILRITQLDLPDMYVVYLPITFSILSVLCFHIMHKALFKRASRALFTSTIYVLYLISTLARDPNGIATRGGHRMFFGVVEDKSITLFLFLPFAVSFLLWYLETGKLKYLLLFGLATAAIAATHPFAYFSLGLVVGSFVLVRLCSFVIEAPEFARALSRQEQAWHLASKSYWGQARHTIKNLLLGLLVVVLLIVFPVLQFTSYVEASPDENAFAPESSSLGFEVVRSQLAERHVVFQENGSYVMARSFLEHPWLIMALLVSPLLFVCFRRDLAAQFLFAAFLIPLALVYMPSTATLLCRIITPFQLYRLGWILPVAQVVGLAGYELIAWPGQQLAQRWPRARITVPLLLTLGLLFFAIGIREQLAEGIRHMEAIGAKWSLPEEHEFDLRDIYHQLDNRATGKNAILSNYRVLRHLPAFSAKSSNLIFSHREPEQSQIVESIERLQTLEYLDVESVAFMNQYNVRYVIWEKQEILNHQFQLLAPAFEELYENNTYALYEVKSFSATHTIAGNTSLLEENWHDAIDDFNAALEADNRDAAAHFGLGRVHLALGNWEEAVAHYSMAVRFSSSPGDTLQHIDLGIRREYLATYLNFGNNYPTPGPVSDAGVVVYDFLANLPSAKQGLAPYRSVFIIDGEPRAVLFQHPPSQLDFQVAVPTAGRLDFDLALSNEVWRLGAGDGVEFTIKLSDKTDTFVLFSEYLDPKNILSHRRWNERSVDLDTWAGQAVTITLQTLEGPNGNSLYDWAGWGAPQIFQPSQLGVK